VKIVATQEGIEINGVFLSNTWEIQTFINAHAPSDLQVGIGAVNPIDLHVFFRGVYSFPLHDLYVDLGIISPKDLEVNLGINLPMTLAAVIDSHLPRDLLISTYAVAPHDLYVEFWIAHHHYLESFINSHSPVDLPINFGIFNILALSGYIGAHPPMDLATLLRVVKTGNRALTIYLAANKTGMLDLTLDMYIWGMRQLDVNLGGHLPEDLDVDVWVWGYHDLPALIETAYPSTLAVDIIPTPEEGVDLRVLHSASHTSYFSVVFDTWTTWKELAVNLLGLYSYNLDVNFTMGGYLPLYIDVPMTTGYKNLFVTLKPSSRVQTTFIPIYTMEIRDLIISINQGWPCGFGSSYRLLEVYCNPSYFLNFSVPFKVIHGSGNPVLGTYINKPYFDTYIRTYALEFWLPEDIVYPDTFISDEVGIVYDNEFDEITQEIITINFSWPRFRRSTGNLNFSVYVTPYKQDKWYSLNVMLRAVKPDLPIMPQSQPLVQRDGYAEPVWPHVFQVKEIELWSEDSSEIVRVIELMFGEQVRKYYWLSRTQTAYAADVFERWTLLASGYLPHAEYSGQIDYVTMREISDMKRYSTVDAAVKALLSNFLYSDLKNLEVSLIASGGYHLLNIYMDIWGRNRFNNLSVKIEPMHPCDLEVSITCV